MFLALYSHTLIAFYLPLYLKLCNTKYETRSCLNREALAAILDSFVFLCYTIYR